MPGRRTATNATSTWRVGRSIKSFTANDCARTQDTVEAANALPFNSVELGARAGGLDMFPDARPDVLRDRCFAELGRRLATMAWTGANRSFLRNAFACG